MNGKRLLVLLLPAAVLGAFVDPVVAYSSVTERIIWNLNNQLLAVAIPITLLVEGILFYTVWKYRNTEEAQPTLENRRLEVTWTIATAIVLLFVGVAAFGGLTSQYVTATQDSVEDTMENGDPVVVDAIGVQWFWEFDYTTEQGNVTVRDDMVIPVDREVIIRTTARDVVHSFHAPGLGLKRDANPGEYNYIQTRATETGTYRLYCAEFCGTGHSEMLGQIHVVNQSTYDEWIQDPQNTTIPTADGESGGESA